MTDIWRLTTNQMIARLRGMGEYDTANRMDSQEIVINQLRVDLKEERQSK